MMPPGGGIDSRSSPVDRRRTFLKESGLRSGLLNFMVGYARVWMACLVCLACVGTGRGREIRSHRSFRSLSTVSKRLVGYGRRLRTNQQPTPPHTRLDKSIDPMNKSAGPSIGRSIRSINQSIDQSIEVAANAAAAEKNAGPGRGGVDSTEASWWDRGSRIIRRPRRHQSRLSPSLSLCCSSNVGKATMLALWDPLHPASTHDADRRSPR